MANIFVKKFDTHCQMFVPLDLRKQFIEKRFTDAVRGVSIWES